MQLRQLILALVLGVSVSAAPLPHRRSTHASHVVLIVWDGMRPDFVTKSNTRNLWQLARGGVTFRNNHCAYPSATNVNGTVFATGLLPGATGLIANLEFRPEIDSESAFDTADAASIRKSDDLPDRPYLAAETIAERLHAAGKTTAIAATKTVGNLFDRPARHSGVAADHSATLAMGDAQPDDVRMLLHDSLDAFPVKATPNTAQDAWTTAALTQILWRHEVPAFSLLWLSDPDFAQHATAPGSPAALAGIKNSDAQLGKVLAALGAKGVRDQTDVMVVSDHGFSTVERAVDVPDLLNAAGFTAVKKLGSSNSAPGTILVVGNGGTVLFYLPDHDPAVIRRLVEWLQQSDFAGVIFAREKLEGVFTLADAEIAKERAPDVVMAFRWSAAANAFGAAGSIIADWNREAGKGTHATLSRFDLHNTLIAAGPDFRRGFTDDLSTGNIDVAPTILSILGVTPKARLDGRVLTEAMPGGKAPSAADVHTDTLEASRDFSSSKWRQHLRISRVAGVRYFEEGNGSSSPERH